MTGERGATRARRPLADEGAQGQDALGLEELERAAMLAWVSENLTLVRRSVSGQRILYWSLGICFVVGLAAHSGAFLLKSSGTTEPLMLVVDLLYALGWALWTGVVLVVFLEVYPEAKKRQYKRALDAYEAAVRDRVRTGSGQAPDRAGAEDMWTRQYKRAVDAYAAAARDRARAESNQASDAVSAEDG